MLNAFIRTTSQASIISGTGIIDSEICGNRNLAATNSVLIVAAHLGLMHHSLWIGAATHVQFFHSRHEGRLSSSLPPLEESTNPIFLRAGLLCQAHRVGSYEGNTPVFIQAIDQVAEGKWWR